MVDNNTVNLQRMAEARNFVEWMYSEVKPHVRGDVLEVGSGIGTYSEMILRDAEHLTVSDIDTEYIHILVNRFKNDDRVMVIPFDLDDVPKQKQYDTIVALNVLEHIKDDVKALQGLYDNLRVGGKLVLLVPAHPWLFNCIDKLTGHYRRYTQQSLFDKIALTNFTIIDWHYFNALAISGWLVSGTIMGKETVSQGSVGLYDKLIPTARWVEEHILNKKLGISIVCILEKQDTVTMAHSTDSSKQCDILPSLTEGASSDETDATQESSCIVPDSSTALSLSEREQSGAVSTGVEISDSPSVS